MTVEELQKKLDQIPDDTRVALRVEKEGWFSGTVKYVAPKSVFGGFLKPSETDDPFPAAIISSFKNDGPRVQ